MPILLTLFVFFPALQLYFYLSGREALDLANALNFGASIFCYHWLLANVILSSKVPLLQRLVPYDARIRFHILATLGITLTLAYHAAYKIAAGKTIDAVSWALLIVFALMLGVAILWVPLPGFSKVRSWLRDRAHKGSSQGYDLLKGFHGGIVLALSLLLFFHILSSSLFNDVPSVSVLAYFAVFLAALASFVLSTLGVFRIGATVLGVEESAGILTVHLDPDRKPRYRSGQFAFFRATGGSGAKEEHPFSFLSFPKEESVKFAIRARGDFTRGLAGLKSGDRVGITGGFGNFRPKREQALCFVASGIGTVPFISILKDLHSRGDNRRLRFYLAVNSEDEIPDLAILRDIEMQMPNLQLTIFSDSRRESRFDREFFEKNLPNLKEYSFYVCSSLYVRNDIVKALRDAGVPEHSLHWEEFSLS